MSDPMEKRWQQVWALFEKVDEQIAETGRQIRELKEQLAEDRRDRQELRKLYARLTSRWGRFVENLIAGGVLQALQAWGIEVSRTAQRVRGICNGRRMEVDVLAVGREQVVVVEVKSEVSVEDIRRFVGKLKEFREFFPEYSGYRIYGAIGGLEFLEESDRYAYRQGLFVLAPRGEERVEILNDADFQPRCF